jgi:hypothetical protein
MVAVIAIDSVVEVMLVQNVVRLKQDGAILDTELVKYLGEDKCGEATPTAEQILFGHELVYLVGKFPNQKSFSLVFHIVSFSIAKIGK